MDGGEALMDFVAWVSLAIRASVMLTVFGLSLRADPEVALYLVRRPRQLARSLLAMNVVMPVVAVVLAMSFPLHPAVKLCGMLAIASIPAFLGITIDHVTLPVLGVFDLGWWQYPVTIVWIVAIANIVNFIDGMDGLAAGFCGIAALTFAVLAASLGREDAAAICAIVAGATLGFLRYNFHPATIFMGDAGALMLGYLLAALSIQGVLKTAAAVSLVFPLVVLALPILDTSFVILKRIKHRQPIYQADRWHFHHRFAAIGYSQRRSAVHLYLWCASLSALALAIRFVPNHRHGWDTITLVVLGVFGLVALATTLTTLYVLEIIKPRHLRAVGLPVRSSEDMPQSGRAA